MTVLNGVRIIEFAGLGPAPFACMMLADHGAEIICIDRPERRAIRDTSDVLSRGKKSVALDLKCPEGVEAAKKLIASADGLVEGYRPGVMEKLGLGPDLCAEINPKLVYGRLTGWGQAGPLAKSAGHDLNYVALSGVLQAMAPADRPAQPSPGFVGDFGGGGMLMAFGLVCALFEAQRSGKGQVIDASICEGSALLTALISGWRESGEWREEPASNIGNGAAPFYNVYRCKDALDITVGAIEPKFYALLLEKLELTEDPLFRKQMDQSNWPNAKARFVEIFAQRNRDDWCALFEGADICFAPVLTMSEAHRHAQNISNQSFLEIDGVTQPAPAPKFSRTPAPKPEAVSETGRDTRAILRELGMTDQQIDLAEGARAGG